MSDSIPTSNEALNDVAAAAAAPTALATYLMQAQPFVPLTTHQGATTPYLFDEAEDKADSEVAAALDAAVAVDLGWLTRIAVTGEDRTRWLAGMTTNAVQALAVDAGNYNFVLNAQGRIQGDLYAFREHEQLVLQTTRAQVEPLLGHFDRFIIMDDVELRPLPGLTALGVVGPKAVRVLGSLGFDATQLEMLRQRAWQWNGISVTVVHAYSTGIPHFELWFDAEYTAAIWTALLANGCSPCGLRAAETLRIAEGIPAYGIDILEKHLAQETSQSRALSFSKGCYLGQEIVERVRSRASIHRFLRHFALSGSLPVPGAELRAEGKVVGNFSSVASFLRQGKVHTYALGMLRAEVLITKAKIEYDGGEALLLESPPNLTAS